MPETPEHTNWFLFGIEQHKREFRPPQIKWSDTSPIPLKSIGIGLFQTFSLPALMQWKWRRLVALICQLEPILAMHIYWPLGLWQCCTLSTAQPVSKSCCINTKMSYSPSCSLLFTSPDGWPLDWLCLLYTWCSITHMQTPFLTLMYVSATLSRHQCLPLTLLQADAVCDSFFSCSPLCKASLSTPLCLLDALLQEKKKKRKLLHLLFNTSSYIVEILNANICHNLPTNIQTLYYINRWRFQTKYPIISVV